MPVLSRRDNVPGMDSLAALALQFAWQFRLRARIALFAKFTEVALGEAKTCVARGRGARLKAIPPAASRLARSEFQIIRANMQKNGLRLRIWLVDLFGFMLPTALAGSAFEKIENAVII